MLIPFPKPDGAHTHAYMYDPAASTIGFPKNRLNSDRKLEYPLPAKFDTSEPLKLIEQCEDNENCPAHDQGKLNPNYMALAEHCPVTANNGCPLFLSAFAENTGRDLGWKEIFEFNDSSVLDIIISNFHKLKDKLNPPLKLGHDEKQALVQNSGFPSAGWITDVKRKAATNKLLAYFANVPEVIIKLIERGAYKRISAELYNNYIDPATSKAYGPTIRAVSILGADVPKIKTLEDLTVIYHSDKLPYKILTEEKTMNGLKKLAETIEATIKELKVDVEKVLEIPEVPEDSEAVVSLKNKIKALEEELAALTTEIKAEVVALKPEEAAIVKPILEALKPIIADIKPKIEALKPKPEPFIPQTQLSETVKTQTAIITKLSESVKIIGSELKDANEHILGSKKDSFRASKGRVFTPAFVDKAMEMLNFTEEDKMFELIDHIVELNKNKALFLSEEAILDEIIEDPKEFKNSQDALHNQITALAEKDKVTYDVAFDRVMALKNLTKK